MPAAAPPPAPAFDPAQHPHRRHDPLGDQWVLVSPHRTQRPWQGQEDAPLRAPAPAHDPDSYLCPGTTRANGVSNPDYAGPYVFANDFAALTADTPAPPQPSSPGATADPLFRSDAARGECRVLCFGPDHGRGLPDMTPTELRAVVDCWADQSAALHARWRHVQIFENKGAAMGCSNPHPHGQIWASDHVPTLVATEARTQAAWHAAHGSAMLLDLAAREAALGERVVCGNADWLAVVPYWAQWPFELLLLPRFAVARIDHLSAVQRAGLAAILGDVTRRYDALFACSFPYSMGWHAAPGGVDTAGWQLHAHFYPPLLRSASVRKFMVGYEMLAEAQRDLTPEQAAQRLRACGSGAGA